MSNTMTDSQIILVDRSRLFREGVRRLFETAPFKVHLEARNLAELFPKLREQTSHDGFVLVEWFADDPDLIREIDELREFGDFKIIALSDQMDSDALVGALKAGVQAFLLRDMSPEALIQSLMLVKAGEVVFPTELATFLIATIKRHSPELNLSGQNRCGLSEREMQILHCLVQGQPNKVIANNLNLAEGTVKVHLKALLRKIKAANRTQAAIWALNHGMSASVSQELH